MHKSYIDKHLLVDRYLRDALDDAEKSAFEERLCWDKELLDEVDLAERLSEAMKESVQNREYSSDNVSSLFGTIISNLFAVPQYAAAASFLVAGALTVFLLKSPLRSDGQSLDYDGWVIDSAMETVSYQLFSVRGAGEQELQLVANTWTVFEVDAVESCTRYRTTLRNVGTTGGSGRRQLTLRPNYQQVLAIGLPAETLDVGRYVLEVEGVEDRNGMRCDHSEEIHFEITAKN